MKMYENQWFFHTFCNISEKIMNFHRKSHQNIDFSEKKTNFIKNLKTSRFNILAHVYARENRISISGTTWTHCFTKKKSNLNSCVDSQETYFSVDYWK